MTNLENRIEPRIHWTEDKLPEHRAEAFKTLSCKICNEMIHAFNNECMQAWVETGKGNYCLRCFSVEVASFGGDESEFGLEE